MSSQRKYLNVHFPTFLLSYYADMSVFAKKIIGETFGILDNIL